MGAFRSLNNTGFNPLGINNCRESVKPNVFYQWGESRKLEVEGNARHLMPLQVSIFRGDSTNEKIRGKAHEDVSHSKQYASCREISYNNNLPKYVIEENTCISL